MMDGDGQNDPADIPMLVSTIHKKKCNMVQGYRQNREDNFVRKVSSRLANGFRNWMTKDSIRDVGCSLRAIERQSLDNLTVFKGMHRFLPTMIRLNGYDNIIEMPVNHRPRLRGLTKYGIGNRLFVGLKDTFAMNWMKERLVKPKIAKISPNAPEIKENHE